ncbi:hypothetical protein DFH94DRAFT_698350 [Russula ochroleuca]|uniref:CCHC-type domain-containing protein n=1 Tax=Russula ochroleuca TaxID=152965 RepID=A0A9P5JVD6_9AGAM|nr:hypothetical protein DFH94DRAFT_698350 [Russula ochroleuca]
MLELKTIVDSHLKMPTPTQRALEDVTSWHMPVNRATLGMCATFCYLTLADGLLPLLLMLDLDCAAHPFVWVTPMPTTTPPSLTTPTPLMPIPIRTHTIASDAQSPTPSLSTPSDEDGIQWPPFLLKHNRYLIEAPWVQYDYSPVCPQLLGTMGKDQPVQARPLVPQKTTDATENYSARKMHLFDQDEPFASWVEEVLESENDPLLKAGIVQYCYSLFHERESEQRLHDAMTDYSTYRLKRLGILGQLQDADTFERLRAQVAWSNHIYLPSKNLTAYKAWREVSTNCPLPLPEKPGFASATHNPKNCRCCMCYKCHKFGHIRATCPSKPTRKHQGYI